MFMRPTNNFKIHIFEADIRSNNYFQNPRLWADIRPKTYFKNPSYQCRLLDKTISLKINVFGADIRPNNYFEIHVYMEEVRLNIILKIFIGQKLDKKCILSPPLLNKNRFKNPLLVIRLEKIF